MPAKAKTTKTVDAAEKAAADERKKLLHTAYSAATKALREAHEEEFKGLYVEAAAELGVDYNPRPNAEQKAEADFKRLITEYPWLLGQHQEELEPELDPDEE